MVADLDLDLIRQVRNTWQFYRDRRPESYNSLVAPETEIEMAKITKIDPKNWKKANIVQIDVDAGDNSEAIEVLEKWAAENGFSRMSEYFLRIVMRADGSRVFRGVCYRITREVKDSCGVRSKPPSSAPEDRRRLAR